MPLIGRIAAATARGYGLFANVVQAVDPFFNYVVALLHGNGTNGGQNNTFLDSSTNNFTITRNGNTTQGSFSPFSQTGWAFYQNPLNDYLNFTTGAGTLFQFTGDYTIEVWVFLPSIGSDTSIWVSNDGSSNYHAFNIDATNYNIYLNSGSPTSSFSHGIALNAWTHVAMVRSGSTVTLYTNGLSRGTITNSSTNGYASPTLARNGGGASGSTARYLSNLRIVKGTAVYTANFTPSTTPLTAISGTSLLTCQANRFLDASSNALVPTVTGSPSVQPFSPFNPTTPYSTSSIGGSGYFDGSGDYLASSANSALALGTGDFTLECWVYATSTPSDVGIYEGRSNGNAGTVDGFTLTAFSGSVIRIYSNATLIASSGTSYVNVWCHVAVVRASGTWTLYINGVSQGTSTTSRDLTNNDALIGAGRYGVTGAATAYFPGYISNFRLVKGTAVYTSNFTPPTTPPTAITNTSLLTNFTNGAIFDNAAVADYETVGNAQISTSVKKYGTGSMAFDGTGDYLLTDPPSAQLMAFGTGDFTIEFWAYFNTTSGDGIIYDSRGPEGFYPTIYRSTTSIIFYTNSAARITASSAVTTNTWYHIALCRTGTSTKMFINGTQVGSTYTDTNAYLNAAQRPIIGAAGVTGYVGVSALNGYIDDLRISKGIARYPYNFTPPTAEFPNIGGTVTLTADPYFDYTTLLLPGNGTNGAQNNTFLDSSTNNFTITRNGNTTQGTFSPFSQTGWGNYFDGTGDYLSAASNAAFGMGSGDYTIECWLYLTGTPTYHGIYSTTGTTSSDIQIQLQNRLLRLSSYTAQVVVANAGTEVPLNEWTHVAFCRSGTTVKLFRNGTEVGSGTDSTTWSTGAIQIGQVFGSLLLNGYMSNLRVVKGTAVYTSNFTPSTTPLTAITNTSLLTCQSNRFIDNSTNAFAITRNGDVSVQAFSPFNPTAAWSASTNGGSGYFDGSGDFLQVADAAPMELGSGNWTIEMWVNTVNSTAYSALFGRDDGAVTAGSYVILLNGATANGIVSFFSADINAFSAAVLTSGTTSCRDGAWHHIAIVRNSNTLTMYIDGTSTSTATFSGSFANTAQPIKIGSETGYSRDYTGYISNVRLVVGTAVYTANFTPPTAPLTAITNTQLLLNNTNAGIYDATSKNDLETVGNAQISTTQSKFGGSSMYFDGTGDWLLAPNNAIYDFGTGDFTIEFWARFDSVGSLIYFITEGTGINGAPNLKTAGWSVIYSSPNLQLQRYDGTTQTIYSFAWTPATGTWYHVAMSRYASSLRCFINGVQTGSTQTSTDSFNRINTTDPLTIGTGVSGGNPGANYSFNGYMQDIRLSKGIARYTSNFTPPTTAFLTL